MMEDFSVLEDISLSSKDGKAIVPAVLSLFQSYHEKLDTMFSSLKNDFVLLLKKKDEEIVELKNSMTVLQRKVVVLEDRIEHNDSYERRDTLVFSGKSVPVKLNPESSSEIICNLLKNFLNMEINPLEISVSHRLPGNNNNPSTTSERTPIIAKFCRREIKIDILNRARKKKPEDLFINECLTPMQQTISYVLRKAKRDFPNIVSGSTTFDGKNFVWIKAPNPAARGAKDTRTQVSTHRRLEEFCIRTLNKPLTDYVREWKH